MGERFDTFCGYSLCTRTRPRPASLDQVWGADQGVHVVRRLRRFRRGERSALTVKRAGPLFSAAPAGISMTTPSPSLRAAFAALDALAEVLSRWPACNQTTDSAPELTGRQTAGPATPGLAPSLSRDRSPRRLYCSKSREAPSARLNRKLEVNDRLATVKRAAELSNTGCLHGPCRDEATWSFDIRGAGHARQEAARRTRGHRGRPSPPS